MYVIDSIGNVFVGRVSQLVADLVEAEILAAELTLQEASEVLAPARVLEQLVDRKAPATYASLWNVLTIFMLNLD